MPMGLQDWRTIAEMLAHATVVLGFPIAIVEFRKRRLREQHDREYGTYNALDEKYLEFQQLCLRMPRLNIFDVPDVTPAPLSEEEKKQEVIAFTMLFSIFERAFLMYYDQNTELRRKQWAGWDQYIRTFCARENFARAWAASGATFDTDFQEYIAAQFPK